MHYLDSGSNLWHCNKFGNLPRCKANAKVEAKRSCSIKIYDKGTMPGGWCECDIFSSGKKNDT